VWHLGDRIVVVGGTLTASATKDAVVLDEDGPDARRLLPTLLGHVLAQHDRYVLHAAVLETDDLVVLGVGPTGRGKSTLAMAAHEAGWAVRSDDTAVARLDPETDDVLVTGLPRTAMVPAELSTGSGAERDHRDRSPLALASPGPERSIDVVAAVAWSALPEGSIQPGEAGAHLPGLVDAFNGNHEPALARRWFPIAARLARGRRVELALGADPHRRLEDTADLLARLAGRT
jgi:hypothetical protein